MPVPLLSLCLIARDEASLLPRCLDSARPWVDETIVLDTGSTDDTPSLAERCGARVFRTGWTGDFSRARNEALGKTTGKFVLVLDADEWVESGPEPGALRDELAVTSEEAFTVEIEDRLDGGGMRRYPLVRLFRNRPEHRYAGAFHEQVTPSIARRSGVEALSPVASGLVIGHDGYALARRAHRGKAERNLELLRAQVRQRPDDPASRYFLARERVPVLAGRAVPGSHLREALEHLDWLRASPESLGSTLSADVARIHAAALLARGAVLEAEQVLATCEDRGVACELLRADVEMLGSDGGRDDIDRALARIERCFDRETRDRGPFSEPALAGPVARARSAEALLLLERYDEAMSRTEEACRMPGAGAAPWTVLGAIERVRGRIVQALRAYAEGIRIDPVDPWVWSGLGEAILEGGDIGGALEPLCSAARLAPGWDRLDETLATAFLLAGHAEQLVAFFGSADRDNGAAGQAALLLGAAATRTACPVKSMDSGVPGSMNRILRRLAAAGRTDLLRHLSDALGSIASSVC